MTFDIRVSAQPRILTNGQRYEKRDSPGTSVDDERVGYKEHVKFPRNRTTIPADKESMAITLDMYNDGMMDMIQHNGDEMDPHAVFITLSPQQIKALMALLPKAKNGLSFEHRSVTRDRRNDMQKREIEQLKKYILKAGLPLPKQGATWKKVLKDVAANKGSR